MSEIQLPDFGELPAGDPRAKQQFQGPDGRLTTIVDTRVPLVRMRRQDLRKMAESQGFDCSNDPRKDDLLSMLNAPRSVRSQVSGRRTLAQAAVTHKSKRAVSAEQTNVGPGQMMGHKDPEQWEIDAVKQATAAHLRGLKHFAFVATLSRVGLEVPAGADRELLIAAYLERLENGEGAQGTPETADPAGAATTERANGEGGPDDDGRADKADAA